MLARPSNSHRVVLAPLLVAALAACAPLPDVVGPRPEWEELSGTLAEEIEHELAEKKIPGFSMALVDREGIVWASGFGYADPEAEIPATASTVYRVGSVSKLFTDTALMQLVERGEIDLDAPVQRYLPDFRPGPIPDGGPGANAVTLGQLVSHRSGLVRESPVGHYFDPTEPSLEATVASLNSTNLVYPPGTKTKYSNAGIAVVGRVIEVTQGVPFEQYVRVHILEPLGMSSTSFGAEPELRARLAKAAMWSYDGRRFDAPTFQLGTGPAGNLSSTVVDMARFIRMLFAGGRATGGVAILSHEALETMWTPRARPEADRGFGVGFHVSRFGEHRAVGHNGAVYGHSTVFKVLPEAGIGVIAVASLDVTNAIVQRIAERALRLMLDAKDRQPASVLAAPPPTRAFSRELAEAVAGVYEHEGKRLDLRFHDGRLWMDDGRAILRELREDPDGAAVADDPSGRSPVGRLSTGGTIEMGGETFRRVSEELPPEPPERWRGLIGEYGWDHNTLFILEKRGKLYALIEWVFSYPLIEVSENVFDFPSYGLYHGESIIFERDASGRATKAVAAEVEFVRREPGAAVAKAFDAAGLRGIDLSIEASPPEQPEGLLEPDLVELNTLDSTVLYDIRYATVYNVFGAASYDEPHSLLQRPAAEALVRVHRALREKGYGLLIYDGYRPWYVTKIFYDSTPESLREFVADPSRGSRHNRGCAVDLTLYDMATGKPVAMGSDFDEFSERSYSAYQGGTSLNRWCRRLLRESMEREGFTGEPLEWWHFDYDGWERYPLTNLRFDEILAPAPGPAVR